MGIELLDGLSRGARQVAVINAVIILRAGLPAESKQVLVPLDGEFRVSAGNRTVAGDVWRMFLPDRHKEAHMRRHGTIRMTHDGDEGRFREFFEERFECAGGL